MSELRPAARTGRVSDDTWARHTAGLQADFSVIEKLNFQPEFRTPIWDYMSALVDDERVGDGKARLTEHRQALERAEQLRDVVEMQARRRLVEQEQEIGDILGL